MGQRGPRPELPEVQRLKGNPGKRAARPSGPSAKGQPFVAAHLHPDAKACVDLIQASMPPATYAALDGFILASFATAWALHKEAVESLADRVSNPAVEVGSTGNRVPSPWVKIVNQQAQIMASLGDRLGLDPKARAALRVGGEDKLKSKFEGLIGGAKLN